MIPRLLTRTVLYMMLASLLVACVDKEQGQCAPPNETVSWHWMKETGPWGWTAYKCILCDESLATEDETGCFYSYPEAGWEDPAPCKADVCSDDPSTNDPVHFDHGAWKHIGPESAVDMSVLPEGEDVVVADVGN